MFSILFHVPPSREDVLVAELYDSGTAGITEEDGGIRAFFETAREAEALLDRFREFAPELREEPSTDWEQVSRDAWPPLLVGERFYVVPPWCADPTPPGRLRLEVYPAMACGTGRHPCTQLCLETLERHIKPGDRVLDVGAGSGVLSTAAQLLGAGCVIGCDVDLDAIRTTRERSRVPMFAGSADAIRSAWADVIVANIDAATIEQLAPELARVRRPSSTLILSGFQHWEAPAGLSPKETRGREEWLCWLC